MRMHRVFFNVWSYKILGEAYMYMSRSMFYIDNVIHLILFFVKMKMDNMFM